MDTELGDDAIPRSVWIAFVDGHVDPLDRRMTEYTCPGAGQADVWGTLRFGWKTSWHCSNGGGLVFCDSPNRKRTSGSSRESTVRYIWTYVPNIAFAGVQRTSRARSGD